MCPTVSSMKAHKIPAVKSSEPNPILLSDVGQQFWIKGFTKKWKKGIDSTGTSIGRFSSEDCKRQDASGDFFRLLLMWFARSRNVLVGVAVAMKIMRTETRTHSMR